ncbi:MAG TPA: ATP-binding protein [Chlamydiales bacterium]|nr:ATP-binding protein [Chlamydiales bacterium]
MVNLISAQIQRVLVENPEIKATQEEIQKCASIAKLYIPEVRTQQWFIVRSIHSSIHSFLVALERFLMKLGLIHLFQKVVSPEEIDAKGQDMILLSTIFSTLTTTLIPLLGPYQGGLMIGGVMASFLALSITYPLWKPFPSCMPRVENWTEKYQNGEMDIGYKRNALLDKIAESLRTSSVLLVGKEGVGKTEAVKELISAIEGGAYPELSGSQVFYVNTADLLSHTDWIPHAHSPLSYLSQAIDGHREKIIFVFDHIHFSCRFRATLAEQFKTMIDSPQNHFPKLIGITDIEKMKQMEKNNRGFIQRFRQIQIQESKTEEIAKILTSVKMRMAPDMLADPSVYQSIAKKSMNIRDAISLLRRAIQKVSTQFSEERQLLWKMKQEMYALSLKGTDEKAFAALNRVLIPALEEKLISKAKESSVSLVLNEAIVEQVLSEDHSIL